MIEPKDKIIKEVVYEDNEKLPETSLPEFIKKAIQIVQHMVNYF